MSEKELGVGVGKNVVKETKQSLGFGASAVIDLESDEVNL